MIFKFNTINNEIFDLLKWELKATFTECKSDFLGIRIGTHFILTSIILFCLLV